MPQKQNNATDPKRATFVSHITTYVFRGLLASIPLFLSYLAIKFIYVMVDRRTRDAIESWTGFQIIGPGFGILIVLIFLYYLGLLASNVVGRKFLGIIEGITARIPILKTTYQVGKQVSLALSLPEKQIFRRALLVEGFRKGEWLIGFVTGEVSNPAKNERLLKIFLPTVPNPTSGFLVLVHESETIDPKWTVDEAMKAIISGGIIGPDVIGQSGMKHAEMDFGDKE